jgi:methionine synthase II (cobalamin-independent)
MNNLRSNSNEKEKSVIDFVLQKSIGTQNTSTLLLKDEVKQFKSATKNFNQLREALLNLGELNERECRARINSFVIDFEQNMQVLMSLTNLFEQKNIFTIEKERNSIFELLNTENINSSVKLSILNEKLTYLTSIIAETFTSIRAKIKDFEDISNKKIMRAKNAFMLNIKKFLI